MKTNKVIKQSKVSKIKILMLFGVVLALLMLPLTFNGGFDLGFNFIDEVYAEKSGSGGGHGGKGTSGGGGQGQQGFMGGKSIDEKVFRGGKSTLSVDDDSDRPPWAGGNKELNPHRGNPNPTPGVKKGDDYGDLWVVVRDPLTGEPILVNGEYQVCLDTACTQIVITVEGELPEGVDAAEVEFGRANIVRSPDKVTEKALDEVISKLEVATTVTLDTAGRLVIDGVTVDSPLENLALYIAIMKADPVLQPFIDKLPEPLPMVAVGALAGAADKTGTVTVDFVAYFNVLADIVDKGEFVDYSAFDYSRDVVYSGDITYFVQDPVTGDVTTVTEPILEAVFGGESYTWDSNVGISDFAQAVDDALQVIEFTHTQVHVAEPTM